jgi:hypothetical protein
LPSLLMPASLAHSCFCLPKPSVSKKGISYTIKLFFQMITMYKMPKVKSKFQNKCKYPNKIEAAYFQTAIWISCFELVLTLGF